MPTRPAFVVVLVLTAVGASAAAGVPALRRHADERDLKQTQAAARQLSMPANGSLSSACHGSGLIGCWTVPAPVEAVRDSVAGTWHPQPTTPLEVACHPVPIRSAGATASATECSVGYRQHERAAFALLRPDFDRQSGKIIGTLVAIHDGSL